MTTLRIKTYPVYCGWCKKLLHKNGAVKNSHGICEDCAAKTLTTMTKMLKGR